jgi:hypothetical protein
VGRVGDGLVIEVEDDGAGRDGELSRVADRVGAIGGSLEQGPAGLRVELPCA